MGVASQSPALWVRILYSENVDFEQVSQVKVLLIFQLRYLLSKKELKTLGTGKNVFEWAVDSGLIKKDIVNSFTLNKIQLEGDQAMATLLKNGSPVSDAVFMFQKEDGAWKFDMFKLISVPETGLDKVRQQAGKRKAELAIYIMEKTYNKKIPIEILNGTLN